MAVSLQAVLSEMGVTSKLPKSLSELDVSDKAIVQLQRAIAQATIRCLSESGKSVVIDIEFHDR